MNSLSPGTTYHFQLVARNAAGATLGEDQTFTTGTPPGSPNAVTGTATEVSETGARLNGTVNADGLTSSYRFEWGTGGDYTQTTSPLQAGSDHSSLAESATLSGLAPGETYNFRIVAENASGAATGSGQQFTTNSPPPGTPSAPSVLTPITPLATQPASPPPAVILPARLSLAGSQHGVVVHGKLQVPAADAGARLEAELLAQSASLARLKRSGSARVGRLIRFSLPAGNVAFAVSLDAAAKRALHRHHRLALSVDIVLVPTHGALVTITRSLVMHA